MIVHRRVAESILARPLKSLESGGTSYYILSSDGTKNLGGPYTKEEAKRRLQQIEYFKRHKNPKSFSEREHDWNEVLIHKGKKKLTRQDIINYYEKNAKKIWKYLDGQYVMVILAVKKNTFIRRRHYGTENKMIRLTSLRGMDNPNSFEYWVYRRAIEFHPTLMSKMTPILWLDLDMHSTKSAETRKKLLGSMRKSIPVIKRVFRSLGVSKVHVYTSGTDGGYHFEGNLNSPANVDTMRKKLRSSLDAAFNGNPLFTTGIAGSGKIRLDTTTLHKLGSLRAPFSMTAEGTPKVQVKS